MVQILDYHSDNKFTVIKTSKIFKNNYRIEHNFLFQKHKSQNPPCFLEFAETYIRLRAFCSSRRLDAF